MPKINNLFCKFCGKKFEGFHNGKYCQDHKSAKSRGIVKKKKIFHNTNMIIKYNGFDLKEESRKCSLDGCKKEYNITLIPGQSIYPKYCEQHRSNFKRSMFHS